MPLYSHPFKDILTMRFLIRIAAIIIVLYTRASAQNLLSIPDTLTGPVFNLTMRDTSKIFYPGFTTATYGVNTDYLGPTLIMWKGDSVLMNVQNELGDTTTLHWHGLHVSPANDGGPHVYVLPGATWTPSWTVRDGASTYWYHPHLHMKTNLQASGGATGMIIVRDSAEAALILPRTYAVDDFPLIIQSKCFDVNKQLVINNHYDSVMMVNGTLNPYLPVPAQVVRFRVLNASPERIYNIGLQNNLVFYQIGSDGGLLPAPVSLTRLRLAPGERAELLLNFSGMNGQSINLMSYAAELPNAIYGAQQPGMGAGQVLPGYSANPLNGSNFNIINFQVTSQTTNPVTAIPPVLLPNNPWPEASAVITRQLTFMPMNMGPTAIQGPFMINNQMYDENVINYTIPLGNTEIWSLTNQTPIAHPFHIHDVQFYILDINGVAPPPSLAGRKDVVLVPAGMGNIRFIAKFESFCDSVYPYMYHCHMLTHEDHGMMGQFIVQCPATTGSQEIVVQNTNAIISPNPGRGVFSLRLPFSKGEKQIQVLNTKGEEVLLLTAGDTEEVKIDISDAAAGMYVLRYFDGREWHCTRVAKY